MKNEAAATLGRSGGLKKSVKKTSACRKNASKSRAKWITAIYYKVSFENGNKREGLFFVKGKKIVDCFDRIVMAIRKEVKSDTADVLECQCRSQEI